MAMRGGGEVVVVEGEGSADPPAAQSFHTCALNTLHLFLACMMEVFLFLINYSGVTTRIFCKLRATDIYG